VCRTVKQIYHLRMLCHRMAVRMLNRSKFILDTLFQQHSENYHIAFQNFLAYGRSVNALAKVRVGAYGEQKLDRHFVSVPNC